MNANPLDLLARLVSFDTETSKSNLPLIRFVTTYLREHGIDVTLTPDTTGEKAALIATIGPRDVPGIVLSGHTDVVPVAGQAWSSDPFTLRVADGRAYGRGAVDMKGFAAICLALVPEFKAARLKRPVHILLSYDEETTCRGPADLIARFGIDLPLPHACIVGEPTMLEVADAHKSVLTFNTSVHGFEVHSSRPSAGANAVYGAAELIMALERFGDVLIAQGDPSGRFDPAYSTVHVGVINGGTARNIVPRLCSFEWEVRGVPGTDPFLALRHLEAVARDSVLPRLRRGWPGADVTTVNEVEVPGLAPQPGSVAETLALRLARRNRTITVAYATEAGHFQAAGIPTIVCGPGSIAQAHQPDEYIEVAQIEAGMAFMRGLIADLAA